jgi:hypothetical protein
MPHFPERAINETERTQEQHPGFLLEATASAGARHASGAARPGRAAAASCTRHQAAFDVGKVRSPRFVSVGQAPQSFLFGSISGSWIAGGRVSVSAEGGDRCGALRAATSCSV